MRKISPPSLGWISDHELGTQEQSEEDFGIIFEPDVYGDTKALTYLTAYQRVPQFLLNHSNIATIKLGSPWFLSDLEEAIRSTLFFSTLLVVEPATNASGDSIERGIFQEGGAGYAYTYYTQDAISTLLEHFGDVVSGRDVILLPHLATAGSARHSVDAYTDFFRIVQPTWKILSKSQSTGLLAPGTFIFDSEEAQMPYFAGGNIRDLLPLRRNEHEAFTQWRRHIDEVLRSSSASESELRQALIEGVAELSHQVSVAQKKGLLDALGVTAVFSGIAAGVLGKEMGLLSASIGSMAGVAAALKGLLEESQSSREASRNPYYFGWLASRIRR